MVHQDHAGQVLQVGHIASPQALRAALYCSTGPGGGVQAGDKQRSAAALFSLKWQEDGTVCFQANNGEQ